MSPSQPTVQTPVLDAEVDDIGLMQGLADQDEAALNLLYDRYNQVVYGLALRILDNQADAEDVTVDVFDQVWRQASRYDSGRGKVLTWLLTVARTRAIDRLRKLQRQSSKRADFVLQMDDYADVTDTGEEVHVSELRDAVRKALQLLPAVKRNAIELAYFSGLSQSEIAKHLDQPLGTIKTRMRTGLGELREALAAFA